MRVDFLATTPHYASHIRPVYDALPEEVRGRFHTNPTPHELSNPCVVASNVDRRNARRAGSRVILFQHGVGQRYEGVADPSYAGAPGINTAVAFPSPNAATAAVWLAAYPDIPAPVVGIPKLDAAPPQYPGRWWGPSGLVAMTFHWPAKLCPEAGTAFPEYADAIARLANEREILLHAHPTYQGVVGGWAAERGIEFTANPDEVLARADMLAADNTSMIWEFANTGRPVLLLNARRYRRRIEHGMRFWREAGVGVQCGTPGDLPAAVEWALEDDELARQGRFESMSRVSPFAGSASRIASEWITDFLKGRQA